MSLSSHLHQLFKFNHDPSSHIFKGSIQKGGCPQGWGGGAYIFLRDPKVGVKKNPVNRNENLQTSLLIKNDRSLTKMI